MNLAKRAHASRFFPRSKYLTDTGGNPMMKKKFRSFTSETRESQFVAAFIKYQGRIELEKLGETELS